MLVVLGELEEDVTPSKEKDAVIAACYQYLAVVRLTFFFLCIIFVVVVVGDGNELYVV